MPAGEFQSVNRYSLQTSPIVAHCDISAKPLALCAPHETNIYFATWHVLLVISRRGASQTLASAN
jgi:hypothetical protein